MTLTQLIVYRNTSELTAKKYLKVSFTTAHFLFYPLEFSVSFKACFKDRGLVASRFAETEDGSDPSGIGLKEDH